jgi:hypothetical protein
LADNLKTKAKPPSEKKHAGRWETGEKNEEMPPENEMGAFLSDYVHNAGSRGGPPRSK